MPSKTGMIIKACWHEATRLGEVEWNKIKGPDKDVLFDYAFGNIKSVQGCFDKEEEEQEFQVLMKKAFKVLKSKNVIKRMIKKITFQKEKEGLNKSKEVEDYKKTIQGVLNGK